MKRKSKKKKGSNEEYWVKEHTVKGYHRKPKKRR